MSLRTISNFITSCCSGTTVSSPKKSQDLSGSTTQQRSDSISIKMGQSQQNQRKSPIKVIIKMVEENKEEEQKDHSPCRARKSLLGNVQLLDGITEEPQGINTLNLKEQSGAFITPKFGFNEPLDEDQENASFSAFLQANFEGNRGSSSRSNKFKTFLDFGCFIASIFESRRRFESKRGQFGSERNQRSLPKPKCPDEPKDDLEQKHLQHADRAQKPDNHHDGPHF